MSIELFPLEKVVIDDVTLYFGMSITDVEATIGKGQFVGGRYYYHESELAINYDSDNKIEFMEFLGGIDGVLKPTIYGISVFDVGADKLVELLKQRNNGEIGDKERGYSYTFLNISVGLYREAIPESVSEMIAEAESFGNPLTAEEIAYETKRAEHWATIGVGVPGYYQR